MLWASISTLDCHSWCCLSNYYVFAKTPLFCRHEGGADTRVGFYVCECGMLFITCVSDVMPYAETLIAWHFIAFNVSLCSRDNSRQKCDEVKEVWKSVMWGFFCFGGKLLNVNCQIRFWRKKDNLWKKDNKTVGSYHKCLFRLSLHVWIHYQRIQSLFLGLNPLKDLFCFSSFCPRVSFRILFTYVSATRNAD